MRSNTTFLLLSLMLVSCSFAEEKPQQPKKQLIDLSKYPSRWDDFKEKPGFEVVQLPAGQVTLKDEGGRETVHEVKSIWMSTHEVRWDEMHIFAFRLDQTDREKAKDVDAENRPSLLYSLPEGCKPGYPANMIHSRTAVQYCKWLSKVTGKKFRLPTDAEWEYACRAAGNAKPMDAKEVAKVAWLWHESDGATQPVGKKNPNAWGLYDMLGNVAEWVVRADGSMVVAGGSFDDDKPERVHPGARGKYSPAWQERDPQDPKSRSWLYSGPHVGFRVVMEE